MCILKIRNNNSVYALFTCFCLMFLLSPFFNIPQGISPVSADDSGAWHMDGAPVIEKSSYKDDACYFGKQLSLSDGSASGTMSWTDVNCVSGSKCSGTYTGSMTWTSPPSFMKPGSKVEFKLAEKTSAQNSCGYKNIGSGGWVSINGTQIVEVRDSLTPTATATYTVVSGSPGSKLAIVVNAKAANLSGKVTYNYTYKGSADSSSPTQIDTASPKTGQAPGPLVESLSAPQGIEPLGFVTSDGSGPIYVSTGPWDVPPSQQKWIAIKGRQPLFDGWIIRTGPGAEAKVQFGTGALTRIRQSSWFEIKPIKVTPTSQSVVYGRLYEGLANFYFDKQKEGSKNFEVETERAIVGIKGTNFVLEANAANTLLKVIEGSVEFTCKQSGQSTTVEAGQKIEATNSGLGQKSSFNTTNEKKSWGDMTISGTTSSSNTQGSSSTTKKPGISLPKCPITAAMATDSSSPRLTIFRNFRDKVLCRSDAGKTLVSFYYGTGTWVVDNILSNDTARFISRQTILEPLSLVLNGSAFIWNK